jgi:polyisoprenoid-binding protein YceI
MYKAAVFAAAVATSVIAFAAGPRTFNVDTEHSRALIAVGKSGAFSFAGHTHEVEAPLTSGVVRLDGDALARSTVRLEFNAAAMRVSGKGEPPGDVPKVTEAMLGPQVLDVKKYPSIVFESTSVTARGALPALDLTVAGKLTIRDMTKPVTAPVAVKVDGSTLTATGKFTIKQTDFGIKPISAGGGAVKVKDELTITFTISAKEQ